MAAFRFIIAVIAATFLITTASASAKEPVDPRGGATSVDYAGSATSQGGFTGTTAADLAQADDINEQLARAADEGPPQRLLDRCLEHENAGKVGGHVLFRHFWCQRNVVHGEYYFNGQKEGEFTIPYRAAAIGNPYTRETRRRNPGRVLGERPAMSRSPDRRAGFG